MAVELAGDDVSLVAEDVLDDVLDGDALVDVALDDALVAGLEATMEEAEPEGVEESPEPPVHCEMTTVSRTSAAPPIPTFLSRLDRLVPPSPVGDAPEGDDPGQVFGDGDAGQAFGPDCSEL